MEREEKLKKVVKEKRSVKKAKALTEPGEARPVIAETKKPSARRKAGSAKTAKKDNEGPTIEQIQLRAYFIGERRASLGMAGDSTSDWVQAESELKEETGLS
jgi:hypothetical protein